MFPPNPLFRKERKEDTADPREDLGPLDPQEKSYISFFFKLSLGSPLFGTGNVFPPIVYGREIPKWWVGDARAVPHAPRPAPSFIGGLRATRPPPP